MAFEDGMRVEALRETLSVNVILEGMFLDQRVTMATDLEYRHALRSSANVWIFHLHGCAAHAPRRHIWQHREFWLSF